MPKTKEENKEYQRLWRLKNKEKMKEYQQEYRLQNKDKMKEYQQGYQGEYRLKNKDKLKDNLKEYYKTYEGKKSYTISKWRERGILCFDFDLLYDIFLSTTRCEFCNVEFTTSRYPTKTTKCLDHNHSIKDKFNVRGVVCHPCNIKDVLK
tara:strand:- start:230 stop:679 length:450 start_codon:yes stop_codon:yes gene_type:complete